MVCVVFAVSAHVQIIKQHKEGEQSAAYIKAVQAVEAAINNPGKWARACDYGAQRNRAPTNTSCRPFEFGASQHLQNYVNGSQPWNDKHGCVLIALCRGLNEDCGLPESIAMINKFAAALDKFNFQTYKIHSVDVRNYESISHLVNTTFGPHVECKKVRLKGKYVTVNGLRDLHQKGSNAIFVVLSANHAYAIDFDGQRAANPAQPYNVDMRLPGWIEKLAGSIDVASLVFRRVLVVRL